MIFIAFKSHFKNRDFSYFDDNFNSLFILNPRLNHNEKPQVLSLELFETMIVIFLFKWFKVSFYLSEKSKGKKER